MKTWILLFAFLTSTAYAAETTSTPKATAPAAMATTDGDFDSLGGNKVLLDRAKALEPDENVSIVQNRTVNLRHRVEIAPEFSGSFGGDTYDRTKSLGLNVQYHFNSHWSAGVKYNYDFNSLTPEGNAMVDQAARDREANPSTPTSPYPQLDYPKSELLALINWYPAYGKVNLLDKGVAHFDFYFVGGYGTEQLVSGATPTYTGGAGLGFWVSQHFTTRLEMRYQNYKAKYFSGDKSLDLAIASIQMGWLL